MPSLRPATRRGARPRTGSRDGRTARRRSTAPGLARRGERAVARHRSRPLEVRVLRLHPLPAPWRSCATPAPPTFSLFRRRPSAVRSPGWSDTTSPAMFPILNTVPSRSPPTPIGRKRWRKNSPRGHGRTTIRSGPQRRRNSACRSAPTCLYGFDPMGHRRSARAIGDRRQGAGPGVWRISRVARRRPSSEWRAERSPSR